NTVFSPCLSGAPLNQIKRIGERLLQKDGQPQIENLLQERFKEAGDVTGVDGNRVLGDMIERGLELPTPEQASTTQAEVFATRYTDK
ncbi:MAG: hypothetical protein WCL11_28245, partial [Verrucomicrobiota bacterium]